MPIPAGPLVHEHIYELLFRVNPTLEARGVHCTKLVRVHVSAQEGY